MKSAQLILELLLENQHIKEPHIKIIQEPCTKSEDKDNTTKEGIIDDDLRKLINEILGIY